MNNTSNNKMSIIFAYLTKISKVYPNLEKQLILLSEMAKDVIHVDRSTIWLHDADNRQLWSKIADGVSPLRVPDNKGMVGHVFETGQYYMTNDTKNDPFFSNYVSKTTNYDTLSALTMPLKNSIGETFGVFQLINKLEGVFDEDDVETFIMISNYCEQALSNSMLHEELENTQRDVLYALSSACEARSRETVFHVKRVSKMARLLGKLYGLENNDLYILELASTLHDIGKIGIPDKILLKPGKLNEEEYKQMKTHTIIGYKILSSMKRNLLRYAGIIAHEHHERWDGYGYPRGIKGNEIHIYARITMISDVFDALAADRIYKKAWERDDIIEYMLSQKGKMFDPRLIDLFMDNIEKFYAILEKYKDIFV